MTNRNKPKAAGGRGRRPSRQAKASSGEASRTLLKKRILALEARYSTLNSKVDEVIKRLIDRGDLI